MVKPLNEVLVKRYRSLRRFVIRPIIGIATTVNALRINNIY